MGMSSICWHLLSADRSKLYFLRQKMQMRPSIFSAPNKKAEKMHIYTCVLSFQLWHASIFLNDTTFGGYLLVCFWRSPIWLVFQADTHSQVQESAQVGTKHVHQSNRTFIHLRPKMFSAPAMALAFLRKFWSWDIISDAAFVHWFIATDLPPICMICQ